MRKHSRPIEVSAGSPFVTVTGGFDGKTRTFNIGAAASLVVAAAGGTILALSGEGVPPKAGWTSFDALRNLGVKVPHTLDEARDSLEEHGFAATSPEHYLPELHGLLQIRREMVRRTALNVSEKLVSPVPGSRLLVGVTHRQPFLKTIPEALVDLGVGHALVFQAIEGSDEAPLDGNSALVRVKDGEAEELRVPPEALGLSRATRADIPWKDPEDEAGRLLDALAGEEGPVYELILYNAALRLWVADDGVPLEAHFERARETLLSGGVLRLLEWLRRSITVGCQPSASLRSVSAVGAGRSQTHRIPPRPSDFALRGLKPKAGC
jgi:anthranilate phosphoribosyltransferase